MKMNKELTMTDTKKRLDGLERIASEHFDYWTEYKGKKTKVINLDAREAVKDLIHQAVAEDRERVRGMIEKRKEPTDGNGALGWWGVNKALDALLFSLDKPLTERTKI